MNKIKITLFFIAVITIIISINNYWISYTSKNKTYNNVLEIPKNKVGLVLGTGKFNHNNQINLYYQHRLDAAHNLFKAGKIEFILISGDNSRKDYDEPTDFKNDLINKGVPENRIFLDYAGFRTLDSVIRAKEIFGQDSITIISQKFHNERAIYLSQHNQINALGYNAEDVSNQYGLKTRIREYIARMKATLDILLNVKPKFLGDKIEIK
jgi:SanA protein